MRDGFWIESEISSKSLMTGNVKTEESRNEIMKRPGQPRLPANATIFCFQPLRLLACNDPSGVLLFSKFVHDGARQLRQISWFDHKRRRQVDHVAKWLDPAAFFDETRT